MRDRLGTAQQLPNPRSEDLIFPSRLTSGFIVVEVRVRRGRVRTLRGRVGCYVAFGVEVCVLVFAPVAGANIVPNDAFVCQHPARIN